MISNNGMNMLLLVIEDLDLARDELDRLIQFCEKRFKVSATVAAVKGYDQELAIWPKDIKEAPKTCVFLTRTIKKTLRDQESTLFKSTEVFEIDTTPGQFRYQIQPVDGSVDYDKFDAHVFNRVSRHKPKGYMYLPYGYTYRMCGHGEIDEFGFRIDTDLASLKKRSPNHLVIATFGGSTTWSIDCLAQETYTAVLEKILSESDEIKARDLTITCLNFGQVAYSVLSEMQAYLLYAAEIRPDIVIAHDGWNDFLYGSYTDPYLLKERKIVYPCDLEPWGQILHDGLDEETTKTAKLPFPLRSAPSHNLDAYFFRKSQFKKIVEADGGTFIWGVQPTLFDKGEVHEAESKFLNDSDPVNKDNWIQVRKKVPVLLREMASAASQHLTHFVDVGSAFKNLDASVQHFTDRIHLSPAGDKKVAEIYAEYIKCKIIEGK